jgi:Lar family restriction alleviation protein
MSDCNCYDCHQIKKHRDKEPPPKQEQGELMPCPFCGGDDVRPYGIRRDSFRVECNNCGNLGPIKKGDRQEAITAWNTRPESQATEQIERLEAEKAEAVELLKTGIKNHTLLFEDAFDKWMDDVDNYLRKQGGQDER